jgi:hypothetical protein
MTIEIRPDGFYLEGSRLAVGDRIELDGAGDGTWHALTIARSDLDDGQGVGPVDGDGAPVDVGPMRAHAIAGTRARRVRP